MMRSSKKISRTVKLAKHTIRIKRADGGETDLMLDSDVKQTENPYKGQEISAKPPMPLGEYIARKIFTPKDESYGASDLGVVQGIKHLPQAALEAIQYPGAALKGELTPGYDPELKQFVGMTKSGMGPIQAAEVGSGLMMTGSLPSIAKGAYNPNVMNVFAGPSAKTADLAALETAKEMASKGASREAIIGETKWFQGADGKWRYEIPDTNAKVNMETLFGQDREDIARKYFEDKGLHPAYVKTTMYPQESAAAFRHADRVLQMQRAPLEGVINHPELFEAYPHLKAADVTENFMPKVGGSYNPNLDEISLKRGMGEDRSRSSLLHEIQHAVQEHEDFGRGSQNIMLHGDTPAWDIYQNIIKDLKTVPSLEEYAKNAGFDTLEAATPSYKEYAKGIKAGNWKPLLPEAQKTALNEAYRRSSGEVEARNVQQRRDMTPEQLAQEHPWATESVPTEQQLVTFDNSKNTLMAENTRKPIDYTSVANAVEEKPKYLFGTESGSTYAQYGDASTIRDKMARPEHPGESGIQPRSYKTIFMDPEHMNAVGSLDQNHNIPTRLVPAPDMPGHVVNQLTEDWGGYKTGQYFTPAPFETKPKVGLHPVEVWTNPDTGNAITHYGNKITHVTESFADGGRVGFADGGAPWNVDLSTNPFEYKPSQGSDVPLANMDLYKGAPLNTPPAQPEQVTDNLAPIPTTVDQTLSGEGGAGAGMGAGANPGGQNGQPGDKNSNQTNSGGLMGGLATAAGYGPGMTIGNTFGGVLGGVLGSVVGGPIGGILGGIAGRHAANALSADDESEDDSDEGDDGGDAGGGTEAGDNNGGAGDGSESGSSGEGSAGDSGGGGKMDGGAITMRRYRTSGGPILITKPMSKVKKGFRPEQSAPSNALINKALGVVSKKT